MNMHAIPHPETRTGISPEVSTWLANQRDGQADYITSRAKDLLAEDGERLRLLRVRRLDRIAAARVAAGGE